MTCLSFKKNLLAHQARLLYQGGKIFRTWTYLSSVVIQRLPTDPARKVTDINSLMVAAASSTGVIKQMFTLVPSHNRTFLPGMYEVATQPTKIGQITNAPTSITSVPLTVRYQPLINLSAETSELARSALSSIIPLVPTPIMTPTINIDSTNLI